MVKANKRLNIRFIKQWGYQTPIAPYHPFLCNLCCSSLWRKEATKNLLGFHTPTALFSNHKSAVFDLQRICGHRKTLAFVRGGKHRIIHDQIKNITGSYTAAKPEF